MSLARLRAREAQTAKRTAARARLAAEAAAAAGVSDPPLASDTERKEQILRQRIRLKEMRRESEARNPVPRLLRQMQLELEKEINELHPGMTAFAHTAAANPAINSRNFIPWARVQLSWLGPHLLVLLLPLMLRLFWFLLYPDAENIADADAEPEAPQRLLSQLGSPQFYLDPAKTLAPANGESVVDAVFAKAERKAATR